MKPRIMILGVGSFAHSMMQILKDAGAEVSCYLTREYGHYGASTVGETWDSGFSPSPLPHIIDFRPDLIIPMSVAWVEEPWAEALIASKVPVLAPLGEGMNIELSRQIATTLCHKYKIPVPVAHQVRNRLEAKKLMETDPRAYVLKNPLCSPYSPIHTIVCESVEDTLGWIERVDYAEGVFLQEYLGSIEIGHMALVNGGSVSSLVTNQEYKRAFTGNMGPIAGAPLAGIVEKDPDDRYGLAETLIRPLCPWFEETGFKGVIQVTALQKEGTWYAVEYNVRLGVTSGALFLRMLENPIEVLLDVMHDKTPQPCWKAEHHYGCTLTIAGHGYPYVIPDVPRLPVTLKGSLDCDLWWNEVDELEGELYMAAHQHLKKGHRIADFNACGANLQDAVQSVYRNAKKLRCLGSYYRLDLAQSLWPPGRGYEIEIMRFHST